MTIKQYNNKPLSRQGFGIIEIIVAMSIMIIVAATGTTVVLHSFSMNRLADEETEATFFAQEGIEALRSLKNQSWANLDTGGESCDDSKSGGVESAANIWSWKDMTDANGNFERTIIIGNVCRDGNGDIAIDGDYDEDTKKITSTVEWQFSPLRTNVVELTAYLTNWEKEVEFFEVGIINGKCGQWGDADLQNIYQDPIIIINPLSFGEEAEDEFTARVRNVSGNSFEVMIQKNGECDGGGGDDQELVYLAMEAGAFTLSDGGLIEAQHYNSDKTLPDDYETVIFQHQDPPYSSNPIVFSQVMTYDESDTDFVRTKQQNIIPSSVDIIMKEEEGDNSHITETIGVFALETE